MLKTVRRLVFLTSFISFYSAGASDIDDQFARSSVQFNPVLQTDFFPVFPMDLKRLITNLVSEHESPLKLARVCKAWYRFIWGRNFSRFRIFGVLSGLLSRKYPTIICNPEVLAERRDMQLWQTAKLRIYRNNIETTIELSSAWPGEYIGPGYTITLNHELFFDYPVFAHHADYCKARFLVVPLLVMKKWIVESRQLQKQGNPLQRNYAGSFRDVMESDPHRWSICIFSHVLVHKNNPAQLTIYNAAHVTTAFREVSGLTLGKLWGFIQYNVDYWPIDYSAGGTVKGKDDRLVFDFS